MDLLLQDGELAINGDGTPVILTGAQALLQRAIILLKTRQGSLPGAPWFGSRLRQLPRTGSRHALEVQALALVREALVPLPEVTVYGVECTYQPKRDQLQLAIQLKGDVLDAVLEVKL
ncbi:MAG: hypothetical protein HFG20_01675 [Anaerotruncus sp.]|nr:hypothetical protein [Anaerotruncus sp.]